MVEARWKLHELGWNPPRFTGQAKATASSRGRLLLDRFFFKRRLRQLLNGKVC